MRQKDWDRWDDLCDSIRDGARTIWTDRHGALILAVAAEVKAAGLDIPKVGPCAGCDYQDEHLGGASCAAGDCIEREAL